MLSAIASANVILTAGFAVLAGFDTHGTVWALFLAGVAAAAAWIPGDANRRRSRHVREVCIATAFFMVAVVVAYEWKLLFPAFVGLALLVLYESWLPVLLLAGAASALMIASNTTVLSNAELSGPERMILLMSYLLQTIGAAVAVWAFTERSRHRQQRLLDRTHAAESLYRTLASNLPRASVFLFDTDLRLQAVEGDALAREWSAEDKLTGDGRRPRPEDLFPPDRAEQLSGVLRAALAGQSTTIEWAAVRGDYCYEITVTPVADDGDVPNAVIGTVIDVTDAKRATEDLRAALERAQYAEEHYRTLVSGLPGISTFLLDAEGRYIAAEGHIFSSGLWEKDEILGRTLADVLPPELVDLAFDSHERAMAGQTTTVDWPSVRAGAVYEVTCTPVRDPDGRITRTLSMAADVTEQRRRTRDLQAALLRAQAAEEQMRSLAANLPDVTVFLLDRDWRFLVAEGALMQADGARSFFFDERGRGRDSADVVPASVRPIWDDLAARAEHGDTVAAEMEGWELIPATVGRMFDVRLVPIAGKDADIETFLVVALDITEQRIAQRAAQAERARADAAELVAAREHAIAEALQASLLPGRLPDVAGVVLAARYAAASSHATVGGDWYDGIALADGRVGLAMGDVVGSGVTAAALMGQLRASLYAYAIETDDPVEVIRRLNRAAVDAGHQIATVCYLIVDPLNMTVTGASAGHPAPLLSSDGEVRPLGDQFGLPLGARAELSAPRWRANLADGDTIVLYTDGLIESSSLPLEAGLRALSAAVAAAHGAEPDDLADALLALRVPDDDATLLVAAIRPLHGPKFGATFIADRSQLRAMRYALRQWLRNNGVGSTVEQEIVLAAGEAATNVVEHAYVVEDGVFDVTADISGDVLSVRVRDYGQWREPHPGRGAGMGTTIMREMTDSVKQTFEADGTTVTLRRTLPAR